MTRVAHHGSFHSRLCNRLGLGHARGGHQDARAGDAGLTAVHETRLDGHWYCDREVGIVEHQYRRFTTQFEGDALQRFGAGAQDGFTHRC